MQSRLGTFPDFYESSRNKDRTCKVLEKWVQEQDIVKLLFCPILFNPMFQFLLSKFLHFLKLIVLIETQSNFDHYDC